MNLTRLALAVLAVPTIGLATAHTATAPAITTVPESMTVSPGFVSDPGDGPGGCSSIPGGPFVCHVTIRNTGELTVSWRSWGLDASGQTTLPAGITPSHGTLVPGSSVRVTISTGYCGFSLADLANFLGWSGTSQAGAPPLGGAVLYSCG